MHMMSQAELSTLLKYKVPVRIIDVRKESAFEKEPSMIIGAERQNYIEATTWGREFFDDDIVICYCVHGHAVSQSAVQALRAHNINAYYLQGGLEAWLHDSGPLAL